LHGLSEFTDISQKSHSRWQAEDFEIAAAGSDLSFTRMPKMAIFAHLEKLARAK